MIFICNLLLCNHAKPSQYSHSALSISACARLLYFTECKQPFWVSEMQVNLDKFTDFVASESKAYHYNRWSLNIKEARFDTTLWLSQALTQLSLCSFLLTVHIQVNLNWNKFPGWVFYRFLWMNERHATPAFRRPVRQSATTPHCFWVGYAKCKQ